MNTSPIVPSKTSPLVRSKPPTNSYLFNLPIDIFREVVSNIDMPDAARLLMASPPTDEHKRLLDEQIERLRPPPPPTTPTQPKVTRRKRL